MHGFSYDCSQNEVYEDSAKYPSLGCQMDWNPWIEAIGAQGTFLARGYSRSRDRAGVM
jgi:hypothetical protein